LSSYYFTVSSLPYLRFEDPPPLSLDAFHTVCVQWLKPTDYRLVSNASLADLSDTHPTCPVLERWREWEISLRDELVKLRAARLGVDPFRYLVPSSFVIGSAELAQEASGMVNPLEAEGLLNRARWRILEELEVGHYFDVERLVVYSLKLQLLERKALYERERGREKFEGIFEKLKEQIKAGES
jgi:hypothetical protein